MATIKLDKNRPVRLAYLKVQKGWSEDSAPEKVVIIHEGKRVEIGLGDECDLIMPFRIAQHYIAKQKNWGATGRGEGNGAVLEIVELAAAKAAVKASEAAAGTNAGDFDLDSCEDYSVLKQKAEELGLEFQGNISKVALKAKIAQALKA